MDIDSSIWDLMAKKMTGELSPGEEQLLNAWLSGSPEGKQIFTRMQEIWDKAGEGENIKVPDEEMVWEKLAHQLKTDEPPVPMKALDNGPGQYKILREPAVIGNRRKQVNLPIAWALLVASVIAFMVISVIYFSGFKVINRAISYPVVSFAEFTILPDKPKAINLLSDSARVYILPDKSRVWLNKNSVVSYLPDFGDSVRKVQLHGEAFFEIQPDPERPFIISANGSETRVIGTAFNLRAYEKDDPVVTVVSGKVAFSNENSVEEKLVLIKGEKATLHKQGGKLVKEKNDDRHFLDWKHILVYKKEISSPANYLSNHAQWKKSIINQTEIRGEIHNSATLATYKNINLKVSYQKKRKRKSHIFTVYKSIGPGETISYKYRLADWFGKTQDVNIEVVDASVSKN